MLALGSVSESQAPALKITFGLRAREEVLKKKRQKAALGLQYEAVLMGISASLIHRVSTAKITLFLHATSPPSIQEYRKAGH